jgi:hypothetical protein
MQSWSSRGLALGAMLLTAAGQRLAAQGGGSPTRICLAPATVEATSGSAASAIDAAREAFTSYLTGPSIRAGQGWRAHRRGQRGSAATERTGWPPSLADQCVETTSR